MEDEGKGHGDENNEETSARSRRYERLEQAKADFEAKAKEIPLEPWQIIMLDVTKMMKQAVKEADLIVREYVGEWEPIKGETVISMGTAIFEATVAAEGGRRMVEAQKDMAQKQHIHGGLILQMGPDGRPLT